MRYSKKINRPEQALQKGFVDFLTLSQPVNCLWFAVPNGGVRSPIEASILKGQGVKAGVADFVLVLRDGRAAFIEFKAPDGTLRPKQKEFARECLRLMIPYRLARSLEEAVDFCRSVGIQFRLSSTDSRKGDT